MRNIGIGLMWGAVSAAVIAGIIVTHDMQCLLAFVIPTWVTLES